MEQAGSTSQVCPLLYHCVLCLIHEFIHARSLKLHSEYPLLLDTLKSALDDPPTPVELEDDPALEQALEVAWECTLLGKSRARAESVLEVSLYHLIESYSEAARDVYDGIFKKELLDDNINESLEGLKLEAVVDAMLSMSILGAPSFQNTGPHMLMSLVVLPALSERNDKFVPKFKSERISQHVLEQYAHLEHRKAKRLLSVYRGNPQSGITAGWIFEGLVHSVLCGQMSSNALHGSLIAMKMKKGTIFVVEQRFGSGKQHLPVYSRSYIVVNLSGAMFAPHCQIVT